MWCSIGAIIHDSPSTRGSDAGEGCKTLFAGGINVDYTRIGCVGHRPIMQAFMDPRGDVIDFALGIGGGDFGICGGLLCAGFDLFSGSRGLLLYLLVGLWRIIAASHTEQGNTG